MITTFQTNNLPRPIEGTIGGIRWTYHPLTSLQNRTHYQAVRTMFGRMSLKPTRSDIQ